MNRQPPPARARCALVLAVSAGLLSAPAGRGDTQSLEAKGVASEGLAAQLQLDPYTRLTFDSALLPLAAANPGATTTAVLTARLAANVPVMVKVEGLSGGAPNLALARTDGAVVPKAAGAALGDDPFAWDLVLEIDSASTSFAAAGSCELSVPQAGAHTLRLTGRLTTHPDYAKTALARAAAPATTVLVTVWSATP